jgi:amino acid adenylation domain-containing protein
MNARESGPVSPSSFVSLLRELAQQRPADIALIVVSEQDGITVDAPFTYAELDNRVRALAVQLQRRFDKGNRVLLMLDNDDHYVVAFFACLYAGLIAVPVFPPESARHQHLARLTGIAVDAQACCVLTVSKVLDLVNASVQDLDTSVIAIDMLGSDGADDWMPHIPTDDDIAFLQYTSGSTSAPKGVMVSHGNLMANERAIGQALAIGPGDLLVSWLPLFHDMGLIGGLLQPFFQGIKLILMTPKYFLERPVRWLQAIARHGGTISGGPDFAYRLCLERIKDTQLTSLDLSSWRIAFSGAEPVRHETLDAFIERFAIAGFAQNSVYPCYGLAEATLMISTSHVNAGLVTTAFAANELRQGHAVPQADGQILVANGGVVAEHQVSIRNPDNGAACKHGTTGEIWASGPSIAQGYWNKPEATAATFVEFDGRTWLRTGDLGFIHQDQLYVAGRIKDLIIVRGHNLYPQDIEQVIEREVEAVRKGRVAAFAVEGSDGEGIGIAAEISRNLQKLMPSDKLVELLSAVVSGTCGEPLQVVLLLNPGALPKTSSGKLQRQACRKGWLEDSLDAYAIYAFGSYPKGGPAQNESRRVDLTETEKNLAGIWADVLKLTSVDRLHRDTHFFTAGGNSLAATQAAVMVEARWGIEFPIRTFFEYPLLSTCATELSRRVENGVMKPQVPLLKVLSRNTPLPLSHAQQRQWFLWQFDPTGTAYHIQGALRLTGECDQAALAIAIDDLVQRHESLRTLFSLGDNGETVQLIQPHGQLPLQFIDLFDAHDGELQAAEVLRQLDAAPFDLTRGPLVRFALVRLADQSHILAVVMHHIIADGISMRILIDELATSYGAASHHSAAVLPDLRIQYADYAQWHRQWLTAGEAERQLAYWCEQLGHSRSVLPLPVDHQRRSIARYSAAHYEFSLPETLSTALRQQAENAGATLFMALLSGLQVLLYRYTGQRDIRVGSPVASRQRVEVQGIVGLFVNTLVLASHIDGRDTVAQVLAQVRDMTLGAQAHQDLPFEQLVEALQPERSLSHNPLFQVMFNHLQEDYRILQGLPQLAVTIEPFRSGAAQFELTLETREDVQGRVRGSFVYARELFEPETIARIASHYLAVLTALATQPHCPVDDIHLLSPEEHQKLNQWGMNDQRYEHAAVQQLFERQAIRRPDAIALICDDQQLTYDDLNRQANQLADHLIRQGVKPETRIGIAVERSIDMVVGLLGILKAGAAYVPLDPEYPQNRLAYMVADSGIQLLLTQSHLRQGLLLDMALDTALAVIELDTIDLRHEPDSNPQLPVHAEQLAYVIYTSGSTGKPKGVMVRHGALGHFLQNMNAQPGITEQDVLVAVTSLSFDIAALELYLPLASGAQVVIATRDKVRDGAALARLIEQHQATILQSTPAGWRLLREAGWEGVPRFKGLCGGEALHADLATDLLDRGVELWNMYGPTETTIWSTIGRVTGDINLGRAIAATRLRVLDAALNPVPVGVAGELYLGGIGLARGYSKRPDLTAERFVADPHSTHGERIYRTGDLVRWSTTGQLEYLGRIDHQVKIRGFRIELGEVETQLLAQPEIREAVVIARESPAGTQLVAYISLHASCSIDVTQVRDRVGKVLPDYMVPGAILVLDKLPLNVNGKVDRKALPPPVATDQPAYEAPAGTVAETIAAIWSEVLGIEAVGIHDNFFDLGGHSLLLTRVQRLLEQRLHTGLAMVDLFQHPTINSLRLRIENTRHSTVVEDSFAQQNERAQRRRAALADRRRVTERIE